MSEQKQFLDAEDLARRYNGRISPKTIANWRYNGLGPVFIKIGGRVFYTVEAVEQWEQNREFAMSMQRRV